MAIDKDKFDIIQVIVPKEIKPLLKSIAKKQKPPLKISPYIVGLIYKAIEEDDKNSRK